MKKTEISRFTRYYTYAGLSALLFMFFSCKKEEIKLSPATQITEAATEDEQAADDLAIQNSLVAWYAFNGNTLDSSGRNNHVIFSNATPDAGVSGERNTAYSFNGVDNYMQVANNRSLNPSKEITLYAMINVNNFYPGPCHNNKILNKGLNDSDSGVYYLQFNDALFYNYNQCFEDLNVTHQTFSAGYGNGAGKAVEVDSLYRIKILKWSPVAFTYDGITSKLYVNGKLTSSHTGPFSFNANRSDLFIGTSNIDNTEYPDWFNGVIDDIKIFKKALTEKQIKRLPNF